MPTRPVIRERVSKLVPPSFSNHRPCRVLAVRPEGANHQWRKIPPRELSIDLEADERLGRVTGRAGAS